MTEPLKAAEAALAELRRGMEADGYVLHADALKGGVLEVRIEATDGACEECLIPKEMLQGMIQVSLPSSLGVKSVSLTYPND